MNMKGVMGLAGSVTRYRDVDVIGSLCNALQRLGNALQRLGNALQRRRFDWTAR